MDPSANQMPPTILVVDDADSILQLCQRILSKANYKVLIAERPDKAIRVAEEHEGQIDLLLLDILLPPNDIRVAKGHASSIVYGPQLLHHILKRYPLAKILFMSACTPQELQDASIDTLGLPLLRKPFSSAELLATVTNVLMNRRPPLPAFLKKRTSLADMPR